MGVQGSRGDTDRKLASFPIDDRSTPPADFDDLLVLAPSLRGQHVGFENLKISKPGANGNRPEGDGRRHDEHAVSDRASIHDGRDPLHTRMSDRLDQRDGG
jgi:hypothetical protein